MLCENIIVINKDNIMKTRSLIIAFFMLILTVLLSVNTYGEGTLKAGMAKVDITPSVPVQLYGFSSRKDLSKGVHDQLYARIVVFENSGNKLLLISSDLGSYEDDLFAEIKAKLMQKFGLKESEIIISTIHSHSSPIVALKSDWLHENNLKYTKELIARIISGTGDAFAAMKPVTTGFGTGSSPIGSNRREMRPDGAIKLGRNPYGPADKEVLVMKIAADDGSFSGAMFDYATHATSLGFDNYIISGDVLGIAEQFVEKILGKGTVSPVFAGASGDIDPWYRVLPGFNEEPGWIPEPMLLGTLLGEEAVTVYRNIKETKSGGDIASLTYTLQCNHKKNDDKNASAAEKRETVPVNITAAKVGDDVAFISFSVEMLTEVGMEIKEASPFKYTFIITHANGDSGYLPPAYMYKEGGYEATSTPFEIGSAEKVVKQSLTMFYKLK
jgi:hypothetical protein